jgi:hypothetical protein
MTSVCINTLCSTASLHNYGTELQETVASDFAPFSNFRTFIRKLEKGAKSAATVSCTSVP